MRDYFHDRKHPIYCESCESCGHSGCCGGEVCSKIQCLYGDSYEREMRDAFILKDKAMKIAFKSLALAHNAGADVSKYVFEITNNERMIDLYWLQKAGIPKPYLKELFLKQFPDLEEKSIDEALDCRWGWY